MKYKRIKFPQDKTKFLKEVEDYLKKTKTEIDIYSLMDQYPDALHRMIFID